MFVKNSYLTQNVMNLHGVLLLFTVEFQIHGIQLKALMEVLISLQLSNCNHK